MCTTENINHKSLGGCSVDGNKNDSEPQWCGDKTDTIGYLIQTA